MRLHPKTWLPHHFAKKKGVPVVLIAAKRFYSQKEQLKFHFGEAVVLPVLKKASLDPEMATNYRPVANIPFLGKVLEQVVAGQLQALLDETDYLDPFQSGFRPGYSTESALVALYDDLCREKDRGSASLLVLLDLSAAFDTIDHGILDRLAGLGVGGTALQWFRSYLNGRFQKVVLGDYGSAPWQLCHGVPQGSILSPLLFSIYMKPLGEVIRRCGLRNHQYADDTQLYLSFSTNPGEAVAVLNRCLAEVMGWMRANKLKLNPDKTEVLLVGGLGFGEGGFDLALNGVALPLRDKVRSLGVLLDPELSLEAQVTAVARSAFLQLRLINQLGPYLEYDCLATVTHALVTSCLDFCNALYVGLPLKTVRILQLVQNNAARLLMGMGSYVHMTPVLRQLHWLPIEVRAQFKVLVMTYKALNGLGPGYLHERLRPYMPDRPLRSAGEALLREPCVKEIRRVGTRRRAFSAVAPNLWNVLPREVRLALSLFVFRRQVSRALVVVVQKEHSEFSEFPSSGQETISSRMNRIKLWKNEKLRKRSFILQLNWPVSYYYESKNVTTNIHFPNSHTDARFATKGMKSSTESGGVLLRVMSPEQKKEIWKLDKPDLPVYTVSTIKWYNFSRTVPLQPVGENF
ncbi:putative RNA-directed DNA polymerase from transposon BS, partial [Varanus komodoensis]